MRLGLDPATWQDLPELAAPAGTVLLTQGEDARRALVLVSGRVRVEAAGTVLARVDDPGAVVGEMAGLLGTPRSATVTAETDVVYRVVDDVEAFCLERPEAALAIARILAHRLHLLDAYLADVRRQYADRGDHLGMLDTVLAALATATPAEVDAGSDREPEPNA